MPTNARNAAIRRATHAAHRAIDAMDARVLGALTRAYQDAAREIRERIRTAAGAEDVVRLTELRHLLGQVEGVLTRLDQVRGQLMDDALREAAQIGVAPLDPLTGAQLRVTTQSLMKISEEAVRFVRTFVALDGLQLSDRIWAVSNAAREAIVAAIERSVILGSSAEDTVRDLLSRGERLPGGLLAKARSASSGAMSGEVEDALTGAAADARRLVRTEVNRAHGEAFMKAAAEHPDFGGFRYLLSPAHPAPDICDLLSEQNLYGLGKGVYPSREATPWPAHPNTLSYVEIVFVDEITQADREGKETPLQALERLSPERQEGVLGLTKFELFKQGRISIGMIRAKVSDIRERLA